MDLHKLRHLRITCLLALALFLASACGEQRVWHDRTGMEYVYIPPGTFQMGGVLGDIESSGDESPRHNVTITRGFWMSRTEVTVRAYRQFCEATGRSMPDAPPSFNIDWRDLDHPMVNVTWHDAVAYCEWAAVRLPTEAEWEYAARGGQEEWRYKYVWGYNQLPIVNGIKQANLCDETYDGEMGQGYDDGYAFTSPVGSFTANKFGLYNMAGNVAEWCSDWYDSQYYITFRDMANRDLAKDPQGPLSGILRVVRGGSWITLPRYARVSYRGKALPDIWVNNVGFRCVRDVDTLNP